MEYPESRERLDAHSTASTIQYIRIITSFAWLHYRRIMLFETRRPVSVLTWDATASSIWCVAIFCMWGREIDSLRSEFPGRR